ncbi:MULTISPECIES: hypothetical protein [Pseudothermotoga]|uniref:hypothetical protein n=1 Tax=Pseudothermotoga TaxID=1643951 RepID=UPI0011871067|nr:MULTISPECIES: hypothetical protein [Pseudothermotoga]MBC7123058.1 hypothetical protein [Pseudothermotoga sp.]MDI6861795.1 hypothetical protein [Pseudothermotoga sp.]
MKRVDLRKLVFWIALTLVVMNYTAGVFVYRNYARKLSNAKALCTVRFEDGSIAGKIVVEGFEGLKIRPVDYQVYFYDRRGNVLKMVSNSMFGRSEVEFVTSAWTGYEQRDWHAEGYSNVSVEWLWLKLNLFLPLEVKIE